MAPRSPRREARLVLARARARRRGREAGATMFIVATTLALLGAMGVYALNATQTETRSVGYVRQAAQAEHIAMTALTLSAERIRPDTVAIVKAYANNPLYQDKNCRTAIPYVAGQDNPGMRCWRFNPGELQRQLGPSVTVFTPESFSHLGTPGVQADFSAEITNFRDSAGTTTGFATVNGTGIVSTTERIRVTPIGITGHTLLPSPATVGAEVVVFARGYVSTVSISSHIIQRN